MQVKILVTGGAGYIGSHTVRYLLAAGVLPSDIVILDNLERGHADFIPNGVVFQNVDLRDKNAVITLLKKISPDCIIHFAGYAYVGESMQDPMMYFNNNVVGGMNLLSAMIQTDCRNIVFSSSCSVYGKSGEQVLTEGVAPKPENPYAESKLMFERALNWAKRIHGVNYVALRYFNAAGADFGIGEHHDPETHLIPRVLNAALNSDLSVEIYGADYTTPDGTCIRDYVHVTDLADGHYRAMQYLVDQKKSLIVNLGTGMGTSVMEIVKIAEQVADKEIRVDIKPRRLGDVARLVSNNFLAASELGWHPERDIYNIIRSAWAWHKAISDRG